MANHPWNPLPKPPFGDKRKTTTFTAVGRALTAWEGLEETLAHLFSRLCLAEHEIPARTYGVIASSAVRVTMLREAFRCYPFRKHKRLKTFGNFLTRVGYFGERRNEIAHGRSITMWRNGVDIGTFLCPAKYNSKKHLSLAQIQEYVNEAPDAVHAEWHSKIFGDYAYSSKEIRHYEKHFRALDVEALEFLVTMWELQAERDKNLASNVGSS